MLGQGRMGRRRPGFPVNGWGICPDDADDPGGEERWAQLDAFYYHKYGLTEEETTCVLDPKAVYGAEFPGETFQVLKENELKKYGEYRTGRLVQEYYRAWRDSEMSAFDRGCLRERSAAISTLAPSSSVSRKARRSGPRTRPSGGAGSDTGERQATRAGGADGARHGATDRLGLAPAMAPALL
jgi:hypothetical protein